MRAMGPSAGPSRNAPCSASAQLGVMRNLITQGVLADQRPNQKILSAAADGMSRERGTWRALGVSDLTKQMTPRGWAETAMSDPVDVAPGAVEAGYSIRDVQDRVRVRRTITKSNAASSLILHNLRFNESFGDIRENWLKSAELTPTFVFGQGRSGLSGSSAVNSAHLRTFAPSHLHLSGMLRRSSHPSFALANP
jgi:hypothetical protein